MSDRTTRAHKAGEFQSRKVSVTGTTWVVLNDFSSLFSGKNEHSRALRQDWASGWSAISVCVPVYHPLCKKQTNVASGWLTATSGIRKCHEGYGNEIRVDRDLRFHNNFRIGARARVKRVAARSAGISALIKFIQRGLRDHSMASRWSSQIYSGRSNSAAG